MVRVVHGMENLPLSFVERTHDGMIAIGPVVFLESFQGFSELGKRLQYIPLNAFRGGALECRPEYNP